MGLQDVYSGMATTKTDPHHAQRTQKTQDGRSDRASIFGDAFASGDDVILSSEWQLWMAEAILAWQPPSVIVRQLVAAGLTFAEAEQALDTLVGSGTLDMVADILERSRRRDQLSRLRDELRWSWEVPTLEHMPSAEMFFAHWYGSNRPVVVRNFAASWPATNRWTPDWLAENFGEIDVSVCAGRNGDPRPDRNFAAHQTETTLGQFVSDIQQAGATNDLYAVSNNRLMSNPALAPLFADVNPDPEIFPADRIVPGSVALWIGPEGTVTPLHHDTTNVMFCQMYGRKQVTLVAPEEFRVADSAIDFYAKCDIGTPEWKRKFSDVQTLRTLLEPGDAIFIPVGWWHRVESLDISISFSLLGFARPNDFSWFRPGQLR